MGLDRLSLNAIGVVYAPWSDEEVTNLTTWQNSVFVQPLMCVRVHRRGGRLFAQRDGWHCSRCDYIQIWAYEHQIRDKALGASSPIRRQRMAGPES